MLRRSFSPFWFIALLAFFLTCGGSRQADAAPALRGTIDPAPGVDSATDLIYFDPLTNRLFGTGASQLGHIAAISVDAATNTVVRTTELPSIYGQHGALDSAHGRFYVLDQGQNNDHPGRVHALNTTTMAVERVYDLTFSPEQIAVNTSTGKAYLIDSQKTLWELDLSSGTLRMVQSISALRGIAVNSAKNKVYAFESAFDFKGIRIIDPDSGGYLGSIPLPNFKYGTTVVSGDGAKVYVIGTQDTGNSSDPETQFVGQVLTIDGASNALAGSPLTVDKDASEAAYDPAADTLYITSLYSLYPALFHRVNKLELATGTVTKLADLPYASYAGPVAYAPTNKTVYVHVVARQEVPQIITVNSETKAKGGFNIAYSPFALAVDSQRDRVYIKSQNNGEVTVADGTSRAILARISLGGSAIPTESSAAGIAVNSLTERIYAASYVDDANTYTGDSLGVTAIDGATNQVVKRIVLIENHNQSIGFGAVGIVTDETNDRVYASYQYTDPADSTLKAKLAIIDGRRGVATENQILATVALPFAAHHMAFNPATKRLYVLHKFADVADVSVYDTTKFGTAANASLASFDSGCEVPGAIAVNPVTNRIYITDTYNQRVKVVNGAANQDLGFISIHTPQNPYGDGLFGVAVDPGTNRIYVSDNAHDPRVVGTLAVIDGATNTVLTAGFEIGALPYHVAVNTKTHVVFVAKERGSDVAVVDDGPPPTITTSVFPFKGGVFEVKDAHAAVTFAVVGAGGNLTQLLPTGQTLMPSGVIYGFAEPGEYTVKIRVSDASDPSRFSEREYSFKVPGRANPLTISVREVDGSELTQGKLVTLEWTLTNSGTTTAPNVKFKVEPPLGLALQSGTGAPFFVDASGQPSGAPIDPITRRQVVLAGSRSNPLLAIGSDGFQVATFGVGNLKAGGQQKLRATFRVAYDIPTGSDFTFNYAKASLGLKAGQYVDKQMPALNLQIAASAPGAAKPSLSVEVTQTGAGIVYQGEQAVATVGRGSSPVDGSAPARQQNQIVYRVTCRNNGGQASDLLRLLVPIPAGTRYAARSTRVDDVKQRIDPAEIKQGTELQRVFTLPGIAAHSAVTVQFTVTLLPAIKPGFAVVQPGALLFSFELLQPGVNQDPLYAKVVNDSVMAGQAFGDPVDYAKPDKQVSDALFFHNAGGLDASAVVINYKIPSGLVYVDSFLADASGRKLGLSETEQAVFRSQGRLGYDSVIKSGNQITFKAGKRYKGRAGLLVPSGGAGFARVILKPDAGSRPNGGRSLGEWRAIDARGVFVPAPFSASSAPTLRRAATSTRAAAAVSQPAGADYTAHQHRSVDEARTFIVVDGPTFAHAGDDVTYRVTWGRLADSQERDPSPFRELDELGFELPAGLAFIEASRTQSFGTTGDVDPSTDIRPDFQRATWEGDLEPCSVRTATVKAKVTALGGSLIPAPFIVLNSFDNPILGETKPIYVLEEFQNDKQPLLLKYALGPAGAAALGSATRANPAFLAASQQMSTESRSLTVTGADFAHLTQAKVIVVPLGKGRMVAAGGGNFSGQGGAMVAAGGGNLVAAGGGNLIHFDLGAAGSKNGDEILTNIPGMVAAGGMNLIATGANNLIGNDGSTLVGNDGASLIGLDGSTLVGNDGASIAGQNAGTVRGVFRFPTDGSPASFQAVQNGSPSGVPQALPQAYANMVAAGGGNMVAAGGGHILAAGSRGNLVGLDSSTLIGLDGSTLVGNDGASLIGNDGSTVKPPKDLLLFNSSALVGNDGASLVGNDGASLIGLDGSTLKVEQVTRLIGNDGSTIGLLQDGMVVSGATGAPLPVLPSP